MISELVPGLSINFDLDVQNAILREEAIQRQCGSPIGDRRGQKPEGETYDESLREPHVATMALLEELFKGSDAVFALFEEYLNEPSHPGHGAHEASY